MAKLTKLVASALVPLALSTMTSCSVVSDVAVKTYAQAKCALTYNTDDPNFKQCYNNIVKAPYKSTRDR